MNTIQEAAKNYAEGIDDNDYTIETEAAFIRGSEFMQKQYEDQLRWIPVEESLPEASEDKNDWWTSDIKEVFPYSRKCVVENDDGEVFINQYSIIEKTWSDWCGKIIKWRYLEIKSPLSPTPPANPPSSK